MSIPIPMQPPKEFFLRTITKDITPEEGISELIDTFIEWYLYHKSRGVIRNPGNIIIQIKDEKFKIESDYPGPPKNMVPDLLRFGGRVDTGCNKIGAYGIGTKRAIFKLGQDICLEGDDGNEYFYIHIDKDWVKKEDWEDLILEDGKSKGTRFNKIEVCDLYEEIKVEFKSPKFEKDLRERVKATYSYFTNRFIRIIINGVDIEAYDLNLVFEKEKIEPYYREFVESGILVKILVGITKGENDVYGWYVFCNNRLVIMRDTSDRTGFDAANEISYTSPDPYHNIFLGLIFFSSRLFTFDQEYKKYLKEGKICEDLIKLFLQNKIKISPDAEIKPIQKGMRWKIENKHCDNVYMIEVSGDKLCVCTDPINLPEKSSKDDIREDSEVYRIAQDDMRKVTKRFMEYIEVLKENGEDLQDTLKSVETKEIGKSLEEYDGIGEKHEIFKLIDEKTREDIVKGKRRTTSIRFRETVGVVDRVKRELGNVNMSNEEMGKKILQYYRKMEGIYK